jgi:hypothetical protein
MRRRVRVGIRIPIKRMLKTDTRNAELLTGCSEEPENSARPFAIV